MCVIQMAMLKYIIIVSELIFASSCFQPPTSPFSGVIKKSSIKVHPDMRFLLFWLIK